VTLLFWIAGDRLFSVSVRLSCKGKGDWRNICSQMTSQIESERESKWLRNLRKWIRQICPGLFDVCDYDCYTSLCPNCCWWITICNIFFIWGIAGSVHIPKLLTAADFSVFQ
jgi:hypothetical protein